MSILEVGSGSGELLHELADLGLHRVVGIDPFIEKDIIYKNGATVLKASIGDISKLMIEVKFDLIIFNHSLEHSPTPINDLKSATRYLKSNGVILIRVPVSNSALEKKYGIHWWALDAPRHIYLFSAQSINLLAEKCGLTVKSTHFEGTIDDFLASEQHKVGISLLHKDSYVVTKNLSSFSPEQLKTFEADIESQNRQGTASQAGFVLGF
jgi:SAM-dependent methyltransferase